MTPLPGRRDQRKAETRQAISDVATGLIIARGFEAVSMSEIAEAAGVSRKTVFNYFASKEDLVFDRDEEARALLREGMAARTGMTPLAAFQSLVRELLEAAHPLLRINAGAAAFWATVADSPVLTAHARRLQAQLTDDLAKWMAEAIGRAESDAEARLGAAMLLASVVAAYEKGLASQLQGEDPRQAMLQLIVRGGTGVLVALAGTPYTDPGARP
ncbi:MULTISPECIES: TetR/AcrR family transcriptional regulator [Stenotrophomonas]|uniref:TetR family transcriptional regulator n=1 Tax=Stenotrophomonas maltophilia TaxID=40324 RepID=A0A2J0SNU9_STEMA|nr:MULTISPECIES: TetR/AcrR family transcriptional regulator [Stenotrophomonas]MBA0310498.1 TetR family transcriptional regulator [Stenotrophomonas maltophilia]MBH1408493.1 TetR family transcriptional regulator [Stenotrophomonas maltophilia]MBH1745324.1 TetR family transcriptional regulator [Stenotrophomonas maltophilia]MDH1387482.1 TetR/AcrR family transcriptional regulator [Stenotrophomonas sp. GD03701]MDH1392397.1 TetR/AcrR family transcriptional regulator [Stenotrophomonas sp. GD03702]